MKRLGVACAVALMASATLSGCGGNAYCDAAKANKDSLAKVGQTTSMKALQGDATVLRKLGKVAPKDIRGDWTKLADVSAAVVAAWRSVGVDIEDAVAKKKPALTKLSQLSSADKKKLEAARTAFNDAKTERAAIVKSLKQECEVTLS